MLPVSSPAMNEAILAAPAQTYMLMDSGTYSISPGDVRTANGFSFYLPGTGELGVATPASLGALFKSDHERGRHFQGVNVCYADGHVKWIKSQTLLAEARKTTGVPAGCARTTNYPQGNCTGTFPFGNWDPGNS